MEYTLSSKGLTPLYFFLSNGNGNGALDNLSTMYFYNINSRITVEQYETILFLSERRTKDVA